MRRTLIVLICIIQCLLISSWPCFADDPAPERIIRQSWDLFRQARNEKESVTIIVGYSNGRKEEKKLTRWTRFDSASGDGVTIKFTEPALDRGLGLLTLRRTSGDDEQWLKLPSLKKVRKIAVGEQDKYFAGTDFTNEDIRQLIGERIGDFSYALIRTEGSASVIEAVPRSGVETGYGRRLIWIDNRSAVSRVEYYGKNGELLKIQTNSDIVVKENGLWRPDRVEMDNLALKRKTHVHVEVREIDKDVSPAIFAKDFLEGERM